MRRFALVLSVATLAMTGLAACGGSDDSSGDAGNSDVDMAAVEKLNARVAELVKKGDAKSFCNEFAPSQVEDTFGSIKKCITRVKPLMKVMSQSGDFTIESSEIDGNYATVTYTSDQGIGTFTKENGRWYIGAPASE